MTERPRDALLAEYAEVSNNFRLLTDIRFKLLAFLPLASAAAVIASDKGLGLRSLVFSLFGLAVTIGLAIYNTRNDQLYDELIGRAAEIERGLGLPDGAFATRPRDWLRISLRGMTVKIDHGTGVAVIYAASLALWLFGVYAAFLRGLLSVVGGEANSVAKALGPIYAAAFVLTAVTIWFGFKSICLQRAERKRDMRSLAASAVEQLNTLGFSEAASNSKFVETCAKLAGIKAETIAARAAHYGNLDQAALSHYILTEPKLLAASHFVGLLTDMPSRWVMDCATKRREAGEKPA